MLLAAVEAVGSIPLLCITALLTVVYFLMKSGHPDNLPPMPEKPAFLLGHMKMFSGNPRAKMQEWVAKSGNIFSIYAGNKLMVVLSGYDVL